MKLRLNVISIQCANSFLFFLAVLQEYKDLPNWRFQGGNNSSAEAYDIWYYLMLNIVSFSSGSIETSVRRPSSSDVIARTSGDR